MERSADLLGEAHELFARLGRSNEAARSLFMRANAILALGRLDEGKAALERAFSYAHDHHIRWYEDNSAALMAALMAVRCDFAGFEALAEERAADVTYPIPLLRAWRAEMEGDYDRAVSLLPDTGVAGGYPMYLSHILAGRARVMHNAGRIQQAQEQFTRLLEVLQANQTLRASVGRTIDLGAIDYLDEALPHLADDAFMAATEKQMRHWHGVPTPPIYDAIGGRCSSRIFADILVHRGTDDDAAEQYRSSLDWCEREGVPIEAGRCLQGLAEVAERRGERAEALQLFDRAAALFQQHGARLYLNRIIARKLEMQGLSSADVNTSIDRVAAAAQSEHPDLKSHAAPDGTVTIMFSDIEGSTEKTDRLGDRAWMEVLREHNVIVRKQLKAHGGFEVKSEGDGFMVAFQSAGKALECAIAIQQALRERNNGSAEPVLVRIGLHAGEVIKEGEDFFGRNVIMAARVASQACGGEILVSGVLKALLDGSDVPWGQPRTAELKGLSGEHEIWPAAWGQKGTNP